MRGRLRNLKGTKGGLKFIEADIRLVVLVAEELGKGCKLLVGRRGERLADVEQKLLSQHGQSSSHGGRQNVVKVTNRTAALAAMKISIKSRRRSKRNR